jgi:hypothetical protein
MGHEVKDYSIWSFYDFEGHKYLIVIKVEVHNENQGKISNILN